MRVGYLTYEVKGDSLEVTFRDMMDGRKRRKIELDAADMVMLVVGMKEFRSHQRRKAAIATGRADHITSVGVAE